MAETPVTHCCGYTTQKAGPVKSPDSLLNIMKIAVLGAIIAILSPAGLAWGQSTADDSPVAGDSPVSEDSPPIADDSPPVPVDPVFVLIEPVLRDANGEFIDLIFDENVVFVDGEPFGFGNLLDPGQYQVTLDDYQGISGELDCEDFAYNVNPISGNNVLTVQPESAIYCSANYVITQRTSIKIVNVVYNNDGGTLEASEVEYTITGAPGFDVALPDRQRVDVAPGPSLLLVTGRFDIPGYSSHLRKCVDRNTGEILDASLLNGIDVPIGAKVQCTIVHNDLKTKIKINTRLINNGGGSASADDINAQLDGYPVNSGEWITITPGEHSLTFDELDGYFLQRFDCRQVRGGGGLVSNDTVFLEAGAKLVCTITQNDYATQIKLVPIVRDANGKVVRDVTPTLTIDGATVAKNVRTTVDADQAHTIGAELAGYDTTSTTCENRRDRGGFSIDGNDLTLQTGTVVRCVITLREAASY